MSIDSKGRLLVGTSGDKGEVFRIDKPGDKPTKISFPDGVQYIWALESTRDGNVYAATGPSGKLFEISPEGKLKTLLETEENNLLSLASDGKDLLYVGTDPHGLVYRVNRKTAESFVLYNATETEVTALALDQAGNLYAATGEAREELPGQQQSQQTEEQRIGSPEGGSTGVPIPSGPPDQPKPPTPPDPNPGRPNPIPKSPRADAASERSSQNGTRVLSLGGARVVLAMDSKDETPDQSPAAGLPHPPQPGQPQPQPATAPAENQNAQRQPTVDAGAAGEPRPEGNAIYKIDPEGFVTEIFRQPVLVLAMVEKNGTLLVATGSEGQIYQVDPKAGETSVLAKVDSKQVTCLLPARNGDIFVGMSNAGSIATMSDGVAARGTYISQVLDATQISRFGKMQLRGSLPTDTTLLVSTRSGNVKEASDKTWSKWTDDVPAAEFLPINSASARFLQYRLTMTSKAGGASTPVVDEVSIAYQIPNLPPVVKAIKVSGAGDASTQASNANGQPAAGAGGEAPKRPEASPNLTIAWEASDPNNDALAYALYFRRGVDAPWILLKDRLTDLTFEWDTRAVADGRYQIKVVASDAAANQPGTGKSASRISDPVVVDNTPPVIGDLKWKQNGPAVHVELRVADRTSTVASVEYSVDSAKDWQLVLPVDKIYDGPEATVGFDVAGLSPGSHQVTLRATDSKGNQAFENLFIKVEGPEASR